VASLRGLHRNVWATSAASFLTDVSSEMVLSLLPLFLANALGVRTHVIGLVEGVAEATASLVKLGSGALSDRLRARKALAVAGYALSALAKPGFALAGTWAGLAAVRWTDRVGKGIRTAPRDALVADSIDARQRGLAFGFQRAADTAGATLGLGIALAVVWIAQRGGLALGADTFRTVALVSVVPAALGVLVLALGAREVPVAAGAVAAPRAGLRGLGRPFLVYLALAGLFDLGNSSDAFLVLRAQERGVPVVGILAMLVVFNAVYAAVATPAGALSDRVGRRRLIALGWAVYAAIYLGFAVARDAWHVGALWVGYGVYYGLFFGTAKALIADLVPADRRGTAYGAYHAVLGLLDLPASLIAGVLWQGIAGWPGLGPSAPFFFGAATAGLAAALLLACGRVFPPGRGSA
jgi:MFS family permease